MLGTIGADEPDSPHDVVFAAPGHLLLTLGRAGSESLNQMEGVALRGDTLWVSDTYNNRILRYRLR